MNTFFRHHLLSALRGHFPIIKTNENDRRKAETIANDRLFRQASVRPAPACFNKVQLGLVQNLCDSNSVITRLYSSFRLLV